MSPLYRLLKPQYTCKGYATCGLRERAALGTSSSEDCQPSTSGRQVFVVKCWNVFRAFGSSPEQQSSSAQGPAGNQAVTTAGASHIEADAGTSAVVTPFYAGLAQRYPDPDAIPEKVLRQIRHELFGVPVQLREKTGRRALAKPLQGRLLADWYFLPPKEVPGFHNEEREYAVSKALNRRHHKDKGGEGAEDEGKAGKKKK